MRLKPSQANDRLRHQRGLSLFELIITLLVVGIVTATVTALVVTAFDRIQFNERFGQDVRAAESCYETILAIHEGNAWSIVTGSGGDDPEPWQACGPCDPGEADSCPADWTEITNTDGWVDSTETEELLNACSAPALPSSNGFECRGVSLAGDRATQFRIPIRGNNNLELVIPID